MKKRIFFTAVALVLVLVFVIPGCKTPETTTETTETTSDETTADETTADETTADETAEAVEWGNIDWRQFEGTELHGINFIMPIQEVYDKRLAEFEELTGIKIVFEY